MTQMRLMEKLRAHKFTDISYTWNTTYTGILVRSADGNFPANIRTTASQAFTESSADPTFDETSFTFILPRRYEYTTVFDGVARGNVKLLSSIVNDQNCTYMDYYFHAHIYIKSITVGGVATTLGSITTNTVNHHALGGGTVDNLTVDIPFWIDLDNAVLPNDERLILVVTIHAGAWTHSGHVSGTHSASGTFYHAVNTDEIFIELPIIP